MKLKKLFNKEKLKGMVIGSMITVLAVSPLLIFAGSEAITAYLTDIKVMYNGKQLESDTKPIVYNGRTMLGVRALADAFDKNIEWNGESSTVVITDKVKMVEDVLPTKDIDDSKKSNENSNPQDLFVTRFESFLQKGTAKINLYNTTSGKWARNKLVLDGTYAYDIKKTDSIVSPYIATVEFTLRNSSTKTHATKEDALRDNIFTIDKDEDKVVDYVYHQHYRYVYAYQNNTWIFKSSEEYNDNGISESEWVSRDGKNEDSCF